MLHTYTYYMYDTCDICTYIRSLAVMVVLRIFVNKTPSTYEQFMHKTKVEDLHSHIHTRVAVIVIVINY